MIKQPTDPIEIGKDACPARGRDVGHGSEAQNIVSPLFADEILNGPLRTTGPPPNGDGSGLGSGKELEAGRTVGGGVAAARHAAVAQHAAVA